MNKKTKLRIVVISLSLIIASSHLLSKREHEHRIYVNEEVEEEPLYFKSCSAGDVFIGTSSDYIKHGIPEGIAVIDKRNTDNPDMVIINSYKIRSKHEMCEILQILEDYNELYPSKWNRTIEAMKNEWELHNLLYTFNISLDHTTDVDLDNEDETKFNSKILTYALKNSE